MRSAERFGELRRRFQRAAGLTDEEIATAVAAAMPQPVETVPFVESAAEAELAEFPVAAHAEVTPELEELPEIKITEQATEPAAAEATVTSGREEVDLSSEWATLLDETRQPAPEIAASTADVAREEMELPEFLVQEEAPVVGCRWT